MFFMSGQGWQVRLLEADLKTSEAMQTSGARQMLEHAIETGRGGEFLKLTPEQHARLKRS
jgi:hypothetical protein